VLNVQGGDWGIVSVSLQRPDQRNRLAPQDGIDTTRAFTPSAASRSRRPGGDRHLRPGRDQHHIGFAIAVRQPLPDIDGLLIRHA
jgi:hypothetical protein